MALVERRGVTCGGEGMERTAGYGGGGADGLVAEEEAEVARDTMEISSHLLLLLLLLLPLLLPMSPELPRGTTSSSSSSSSSSSRSLA